MNRLLLAVVAALVCLAPAGSAAGQGGEQTGLPEEGGWSLGPSLLAPVSEQAVVAFQGKVYILGGYPGDRIPVDTVFIYDPATRRWDYGPALPLPLHHAMAAAVGGNLYLIGGEYLGAGTGQPSLYLNTVFMLNPAAGDWEPRAQMPTARRAGGAVVIDGKIYVAGGRPPRGHDFAVYDPAADAWTVLPDLPTDRNHLGAAAIGGKLYVAGGRFGGGFNSERTDAVEMYDPAAGSWTTRASLPGPQGGVASVEANGCLFIAGGEGNYVDPRGLSPQAEVYDPRTNTWMSMPPMPTPTHGLVGGAFIDGVVYLPGGSVTQGTSAASSIHWTYRPEATCG